MENSLENHVYYNNQIEYLYKDTSKNFRFRK